MNNVSGLRSHLHGVLRAYLTLLVKAGTRALPEDALQRNVLNLTAALTATARDVLEEDEAMGVFSVMGQEAKDFLTSSNPLLPAQLAIDSAYLTHNTLFGDNCYFRWFKVGRTTSRH